MLRLWKWYRNCLAVHPVKTQVISSGLIWGFGDIAAQSITNCTKKQQCQEDTENGRLKINWKRVATTSLFGFGFVGPIGHFWYEGLDKFIRLRLVMRPNSLQFVAAKVAIDGFVFGPLDLLVFFTYMGFSAGKSVPQIKEDLKRDFLPALIVEGGIWPVVQGVNFRFVPVKYQLLYVNFFCLLDSCFLSWIEQQQDAPWKQWFKSFQPLKDKKAAIHEITEAISWNLFIYCSPTNSLLDADIIDSVLSESLLELDGLRPYSLVVPLYPLMPYCLLDNAMSCSFLS